MGAPSTFSYAQAAKGHGMPSVAPPSNPSAQAQGPQPVVSVVVLPDKPTNPSGMPRSADAAPSMAEKQEVDSSFGSESDMRSEPATERRLESKRDDDAARIDRPWRRADTGARSSSSTAQSVEEYDARKPRTTGKKTWTSDSLADDHVTSADKEQMPLQEAHRIELSEAPIPSINVWQQRKEAQLAKSKPVTDSGHGTTNGVPAQPEAVKRPAPTKPVHDCPPARDATPTNGAKPIRHMADIARSERNGSRSQRPTDGDHPKEAKSEMLPFVEDAASWPTPETAIKEEKRKSVPSQADRQDREPKEGPEEGSQAKPRQKGKWVAYDYVPSVSFETQMPQMRTSKPRGGARGSAGPRTPIGTTAGDRAAQATAASKTNDSKDRQRDSGPGSVRTSSSPPSTKRSSMDASAVKDQKKLAGQATGEKTKDIMSQFDRSLEQGQGARDRAEGRADKGRGSFRGRGGHHSISTHSQHHQAGYASGSMQSRPQGPYSPPPRQGGHGQAFMPHQTRGGRGRNGAGANYHRMSLPNGSTRLPPVQTQFGPYEYPMAPLSAIPPFQPQPYWDSVVFSLLKNQIEYYFSIENLCKDMYLRRRMDSQGLVHLHFVAAFKRIRDLTSDMGMIRAVCESSGELDFVVGEDDVERLRRRSGWKSFVLPMDDRDDFARTDGPARLTFKNRSYALGPQFNGMTPASFGVSPSLAYNPQAEAQFQQLPDGHVLFNETANSSGSVGYGGSSLSAEVPVFSPLGSAPPSGFASSIGQGNGIKTAATGSMESGVEVKASEPLGKTNGYGDESAASPTTSSSMNPSGNGAAH
ncbi:hypothetical protein XA68_10625 [Ophiocordyceps unilateralis]|uniref:HTH La-type RNA-binding domain-containing protein n=1 Tax=Ophiocordyceps unilateralis TaxID=268505 RepID=A0A2A9PHC6_OPHUN|nr:hypothetical protein XA68_10625 [Ophiocordyceps unilateralis]